MSRTDAQRIAAMHEIADGIHREPLKMHRAMGTFVLLVVAVSALVGGLLGALVAVSFR